MEATDAGSKDVQCAAKPLKENVEPETSLEVEVGHLRD